MSDGAVKNTGLLLCTDGFTVPELVRLMNILMMLGDTSWSVHFTIAQDYHESILNRVI
jgi:hypothetical protein